MRCFRMDLYFVCLFRVFRRTREFLENVTITGQGLQTLTFTRPSLNNGHLKGPVTFAAGPEHLVVELLLTVLTTEICLMFFHPFSPIQNLPT